MEACGAVNTEAPAKRERRATASVGSSSDERNRVRTADRDTEGGAAAGNALRKRDDVLASAA